MTCAADNCHLEVTSGQGSLESSWLAASPKPGLVAYATCDWKPDRRPGWQTSMPGVTGMLQASSGHSQHAGKDRPAAWQEWLEAFSWTEDERDPFIARRNARSPDCEALANEPMFCYETAAKCFYWSYYVYIYSEVHWRPLAQPVGSLPNICMTCSCALPDGTPLWWPAGCAQLSVRRNALLHWEVACEAWAHVCTAWPTAQGPACIASAALPQTTCMCAAT